MLDTYLAYLILLALITFAYVQIFCSALSNINVRSSLSSYLTKVFIYSSLVDLITLLTAKIA
jgi:hypothetical protein